MILFFKYDTGTCTVGGSEQSSIPYNVTHINTEDIKHMTLC